MSLISSRSQGHQSRRHSLLMKMGLDDQNSQNRALLRIDDMVVHCFNGGGCPGRPIFNT